MKSVKTNSFSLNSSIQIYNENSSIDSVFFHENKDNKITKIKHKTILKTKRKNSTTTTQFVFVEQSNIIYF